MTALDPVQWSPLPVIAKILPPTAILTASLCCDSRPKALLALVLFCKCRKKLLHDSTKLFAKLNALLELYIKQKRFTRKTIR